MKKLPYLPYLPWQEEEYLKTLKMPVWAYLVIVLAVTLAASIDYWVDLLFRNLGI